MKKLASMLIILALVLALCIPALAEEAKPSLKIGQLSYLSRTDADINEDMDEMAEEPDSKYDALTQNDASIVFYDSLNEMLMALDAGQIQWACVDEPTAQYILSLNDAYAQRAPAVEQQLGYSMLFLEDSAALCDSFNTAIAAMQEDGTLDKLAEQHIDGVIAGATPEAVDFPEFDGADTITVAVTGDLPPMDYVDDAGYAAGFNTAVLAEIANRLQINIELIQVNSGARAMALSSGRADAVFWMKNNINHAFNDTPEGTVSTDIYYGTRTDIVTLKAE